MNPLFILKACYNAYELVTGKTHTKGNGGKNKKNIDAQKYLGLTGDVYGGIWNYNSSSEVQ